MSAGMQFFRSTDLKLQFDSSAYTLAYIRKGTGTTVARSYSNTAQSEAVIARDNSRQLIAVSCQYAFARYGSSGSSFRYVCSGPVGTAYTYYVFDIPVDLAPLSSGEAGVEFINPDNGNKLMYCSKYDTFRVAGLLSEDQSMNLDGSRTYAAVAQDIAGHNRSTDGLRRDGTPWDEGTPSDGNHNWTRQQDGKLTGISINGGQIAAQGVSFDDVIGSAGSNKPAPDPITEWWNVPLSNAMIIDVTGFA